MMSFLCRVWEARYDERRRMAGKCLRRAGTFEDEDLFSETLTGYLEGVLGAGALDDKAEVSSRACCSDSFCSCSKV